MKKRIAQFEKVSFTRFMCDMLDVGNWTGEELAEMHDNIKLPTRATNGSAGYDFYAPFDIDGAEWDGKVIPTGIRCKIDGDYFLMIMPRSGLGFKYGLALSNTVGIIDSDYYHAANGGHIKAKFRADDTSYQIKAGDRFMQGIFMPYGITDDDDVTADRTGGFGSTGN